MISYTPREELYLARITFKTQVSYVLVYDEQFVLIRKLGKKRSFYNWRRHTQTAFKSYTASLLRTPLSLCEPYSISKRIISYDYPSLGDSADSLFRNYYTINIALTVIYQALQKEIKKLELSEEMHNLSFYLKNCSYVLSKKTQQFNKTFLHLRANEHCIPKLVHTCTSLGKLFVSFYRGTKIHMKVLKAKNHESI